MKKLLLIAIGSLGLSACGSSSDRPAPAGTGGASGSSSGGTSGSGGGGSGGTAGAGSGGTAGSSGGAAGSSGGAAGSSGGAAGSASGGAAGSASGGAAGSASGGAAGSGGAPSCADLQNTMATTLLGAVKCNGSATVTQCDGSAVGHDACGCKVLFNENLDQQVKQANAAYDAWVTAGCGPFACGKACIEGTTGACDATSGTCQWQ